jgi:hypothetical protein
MRCSQRNKLAHGPMGQYKLCNWPISFILHRNAGSLFIGHSNHLPANLGGAPSLSCNGVNGPILGIGSSISSHIRDESAESLDKNGRGRGLEGKYRLINPESIRRRCTKD